MIIHEETAEYTPWIKLIFLIPVGLFIGAIVSAYYQELEGSLFLVGEGITGARYSLTFLGHSIGS
ncbi:hypothetical protein ACFLVX_03745 [Chloroflexota bacterium]